MYTGCLHCEKNCELNHCQGKMKTNETLINYFSQSIRQINITVIKINPFVKRLSRFSAALNSVKNGESRIFDVEAFRLRCHRCR